ncbi:hypothetical protein [Hazenella coriacea]|uniref:Uncharacterized protein n=1 Tax=Hazenella coriacea TaxID=1179467 RepID=A0A4R3L4H6_9BACL|nr:hypothetical protein [Hazenella coriacea]TCS93630.1 hypothetical protein EDD58_10663 [Hazenella coriacea]
MSMPSFKGLVPKNLGRKEAINLLLASIAAEELGLAHIINAEAEKIQFTVGTLHCHRHHHDHEQDRHEHHHRHHHHDCFPDKDNCSCFKEIPCPSIKDLLKINRSVEKVLRTVVKKEIILQFKLSEVIELIGLSKEEEEFEKDLEKDLDEKRELEESINEENLL